MNQSHAAGRKTENVLGQLVQHLDRQLGRLTEALGQCLDQAGAVPREEDEYGHHRAGEINHAMQIARTSAKLIASLAKLDREFRHNVTVSRIDAAPPEPLPAPPRAQKRLKNTGYEYPTEEEMEDMTSEEIMDVVRARRRGDPPPNS